MMCHKKDTDTLSVEMKDCMMDCLGDGCSVVTKCQTEVSFDDPPELCSSEARTDLESIFQSSADGIDVRDIRVDEGVPTNIKVLVEDTTDGHKFIIKDSDAENDTTYGLDNVKVKVEWPVPLGLKSMAHEASKEDFNGCDCMVLGHQSKSDSEPTYLDSSDPKDKVVDTLVSDDLYTELLLQSNPLVDCRSCDKPNILHHGSVAEFKVLKSNPK